MANYNLTLEQLQAAKEAKSPEELVSLAKDHGYDIAPGRAAAFLSPESAQAGQIADEELDNVAGGHGGSCHNNGREVVTPFTICVHGLKTENESPRKRVCGDSRNGNNGAGIGEKDCDWLSYEKGLWLCNYPQHMKK